MRDIDQLFGDLRRTEPHVDDAGFTSAVVAQLPRPHELPAWVKNCILLAATLAGSGVVAWAVPPSEMASLLTSFRLSLQMLIAAGIGVYAFSYGAVWVAARS